MRNKLMSVVLVTFSVMALAMWTMPSRVVSPTPAAQLNRITLYASDGHVMRVWDTPSSVGALDYGFVFYDSRGDSVKVSGTVVVEKIYTRGDQ